MPDIKSWDYNNDDNGLKDIVPGDQVNQAQQTSAAYKQMGDSLAKSVIEDDENKNRAANVYRKNDDQSFLSDEDGENSFFAMSLGTYFEIIFGPLFNKNTKKRGFLRSVFYIIFLIILAIISYFIFSVVPNL